MKASLKVRKTHRYLGLIIGIQFLMWTISGLYFSWTNLDEIHGDQFLNDPLPKKSFSNLYSLEEVSDIRSLELVNIIDKPYYWLNDEQLYDAKTATILSYSFLIK